MRGFLDEDTGDDGDFGSLDVRETEITGRLTGEKTKKAFEIDDGTRKTWVPFSQLRGQEQSGRDVVTIRVPEWWAKKNGLI